MFQRFTQLSVAFLDFFEEAHVLDGDNRLRSKSFKQFDLFLGERAHLQAAYMNRPDRNSLAQQRCGEDCPNADTSGEARCKFILWDCCEVFNMKGLSVNYSSRGYVLTIHWNSFPPPASRQRPVISNWSKIVAINAMND